MRKITSRDILDYRKFTKKPLVWILAIPNRPAVVCGELDFKDVINPPHKLGQIMKGISIGRTPGFCIRIR